MSVTRVDLPEPETPVTTVMTPSGKCAVTCWRLCAMASSTVIHLPVSGRGCGRATISILPARYWPVSEAGFGHDLCGRAVGDEVAAVLAGAGAEVEDVVGVADGVFVVLDDEDGVAEVAEVFEGLEEALVVALVEADGGLVEHVEDAAEAGADLRGEADALAFAAGEGGGGAVEREVVEADGVEEFEALDDLALQAVGDDCFAAGEVQGASDGEGAFEGEGGEVGDGEVRGLRWSVYPTQAELGWGTRVLWERNGDGDGEGFGAEALAVAARAGGRGHVLHHVFAIALGFGFVEVGAEIGEDAVEAGSAGFASWAARRGTGPARPW